MLRGRRRAPRGGRIGPKRSPRRTTAIALTRRLELKNSNFSLDHNFEDPRIGGGAVSTNPGPSWHGIESGDFNGDGHSDILFQNTSGQTSIWEMDCNTRIGGGAASANPGPNWKAIGLT
jgi:hypothetical protein